MLRSFWAFLVLLLTAFSTATAVASLQIDAADAFYQRLWTAAGFAPSLPRGDVIRYTLRRGHGYGSFPTGRIVQVDWPYEGGQPRALLIELVGTVTDDVWRETGRREASLHPVEFDQLVRNVTAAAQAMDHRSHRGAMTVCSHADHSRLEISLPDQQRLWLIREAHCSRDAPAVVAGALLSAVVERSLSRSRGN